MEIVHRSVMIEEVITALRPETPGSLLVDCTLGEGGHSERFLRDFADLQVCGIDADAAILSKAKIRLSAYGDRMRFFNGWYDDFWVSFPLERKPDRVLFDLGISIFHYVESGRGFSFMSEELLDMRLSQTAGPSVAGLLAGLSETELADIIYQYGEERYSRRIARAICQQRETTPIQTTKELADLIWRAVPADYRHGRIHPATRSFQALRIAANQELTRIDRALQAAFTQLAPNGLIGVITFHSLEDRLVKLFFREMAKDCTCPPEQARCTCDRVPRGRILTKKPLVATDDEVRLNPPSRSAKFRVLQKVKG
jgi:16S rRNA (cytosine1402-N4)-methyltransferase